MNSQETKLISNAIHSMRGQLTISKFDEDVSKAQTIDSIANFLTRLELYDQSKRAAGIYSEVSLNKVLLEVTDALNSERIVVSSKPLRVNGDYAHIKAMLRELVINALRFSEDDVQVSLHKSSSSAVIRIEDSGGGMSEQTQRLIAEPFARSNSQNAGHGLGLAIAWAVTQEHEGAMTILNDPGVGVVVIVVLDLV